jgi:hypothetical protein
MNTYCSKRRKHGKKAGPVRTLALLAITALALAASPTALADDRGRPGAPSVQQSNANTFSFVLRKSLLRLVSWSD